MVPRQSCFRTFVTGDVEPQGALPTPSAYAPTIAPTTERPPAAAEGLVLLQEAAGGYVTYDFCSELGWSLCTAAQAPKLIIWHR